MIGTALVESLVQAVALSHRIKGYSRVSLLLLAAPESGKTTIATAATCEHVARVAMISGRSVLKEMADHPKTEFLLFNDLSAVKAMSFTAVNLLIVLLNQLTQDEHGIVAFAGQPAELITRQVGVIGCMPFDTFIDHRSRWRALGFISRMIPFAYRYRAELIAEIKDSIDGGEHVKKRQSTRKLPRRSVQRPVSISLTDARTKVVRRLADAKATELGQHGIRLLANYHSLIRAHALLEHRRHVNDSDLAWLRAVNAYVSVSECRPLAEE